MHMISTYIWGIIQLNYRNVNFSYLPVRYRTGTNDDMKFFHIFA